MARRVFLLGLLLGCTQDFGVFDPAEAGAVDATMESGSDGAADAAIDAAVDGTAGDSSADAPIDVASDGGIPCTETGAVQLGGHCYFLVATAANAQAAQTTCKGTGAHLATLTATAEQTAVAALGAGTERWIRALSRERRGDRRELRMGHERGARRLRGLVAG